MTEAEQQAKKKALELAISHIEKKFGDGSIMMNLQELETISYKNIPAKID